MFRNNRFTKHTTNALLRPTKLNSKLFSTTPPQQQNPSQPQLIQPTQRPRNFKEYKEVWKNATPQQRFQMGLNTFTSLGVLSIAMQPAVTNAFNDTASMLGFDAQPAHNINTSAVNTTTSNDDNTIRNYTSSNNNNNDNSLAFSANILKYKALLQQDFASSTHNTASATANAMLDVLNMNYLQQQAQQQQQQQNTLLASVLPDRPPFDVFDKRMIVAESDDPEVRREQRALQRKKSAEDQDLEYRMHKHEKFLEFQKNADGVYEDDDEDFMASRWMIEHASPLYRSQHRDKTDVKLATMITHGMQELPPLLVDGRLYPTYDSYMQAEGFKPMKGNSFDTRGSYGLAGAFAAITAAYNLLPKSENFFVKNFTLSYDNRWKPWTYATSMMTHFNLPHLGFNTMAMLSFAPSLGVQTPPAFLAVFGGLGLFSSAISLFMTLTVAKLLLLKGIARPSLLTPAVGASGALTGFVALSALTRPDQKAGVFFIPYQFNIMNLLATFMALDFAGFIAQCCGKSTGLSHSGHLAGYLGGILLFNHAKNTFESKYAAGTYRQYVNWVENTFWPSPRTKISESENKRGEAKRFKW